MITAEEARAKIFKDVIEEEKAVSLINLINQYIEDSINHNFLNAKVFLDYTISDFVLLDALKWYYTNLGYKFVYVPHLRYDTSKIEISWNVKED